MPSVLFGAALDGGDPGVVVGRDLFVDAEDGGAFGGGFAADVLAEAAGADGGGAALGVGLARHEAAADAVFGVAAQLSWVDTWCKADGAYVRDERAFAVGAAAHVGALARLAGFE